MHITPLGMGKPHKSPEKRVIPAGFTGLLGKRHIPAQEATGILNSNGMLDAF